MKKEKKAIQTTAPTPSKLEQAQQLANEAMREDMAFCQAKEAELTVWLKDNGVQIYPRVIFDPQGAQFAFSLVKAPATARG